MKVGENFTGENWTGDKTKVQELSEYINGKKLDITSQLSDKKGDSLRLANFEEGTHMVIYNSKNSHINLDAEKFNAYLKEDGLNEALQYCKEHNEMGLASSENYQRSVKTIVQCGTLFDNDCTKPTSLPLDIVPWRNPIQTFPIVATNSLDNKNKYQIYFLGKPMPALLVRHWWKTTNCLVSSKIYTMDKKGWVEIESVKGGENMISCVHMVRLQHDSSAQWQSYWASLTFLPPSGNFFPVRRN